MRFLMVWSRRKFGGALTGAAVSALALPGVLYGAPRTHTVVIRDFAFEPAILKIKAGERVEWINRDIAPHTATARNAAWDTGNLIQDQQGVVAFPKPGREVYVCAYHPHMTGMLIVET
jgi:plastocyanin